MAKLLILQLSDIHIKNEKEAVLERSSQIARAAQSLNSESKCCILVLSGDISYSGTQAEYLIAETFLQDLKSNLKGHFNQIEIVVVPGNHDCSFNKEDSIRKIVLSQLYSGQTTN